MSQERTMVLEMLAAHTITLEEADPSQLKEQAFRIYENCLTQACCQHQQGKTRYRRVKHKRNTFMVKSWQKIGLGWKGLVEQ